MNNEKQTNPNDYFVTDIDTQAPETTMGDKLEPVKITAQKGAIAIWPAVTRGINNLLYYSLKFIRGTISLLIAQFK